MNRIVSLILILTGISIFFYPTMKDLYTSYNQNKIIKNWEDISVGKTDAADSLGHLEEVFSVKTHAAETDSSESDLNQESTKKPEKKMDKSMIGVIEIDKINLKLPVLNGASKANLDVGSGLLEGTALPGMPGNSAIAAHRSRAFGKMFNRLDEIGNGDVVTVKDQDQTFQYEVYETLVVEPNDLSVLNGSEDEKTLTLITCTPIDTATHRLIIKAKMP